MIQLTRYFKNLSSLVSIFAWSILVNTNTVDAGVTSWKIGGSGLSWSDNDSANVLVEYQSEINAINPLMIHSDTTVFAFLDDWSPKRDPDELGFVDGERPRAWKGCCGTSSTVDNALNLIDGSGETYNPVTSNAISSEYYTIDLGAPMPLFRFGMRTPDKGFFRADGTPLNEDAIPAYEVSIAADTNNDVLFTADPIGEIITEARENVNPNIIVDFPIQYVRYVRYKRKNSVLDAFSNQSSFHAGTARKGTLGEFSLYGEGIPARANYKTKIVELDDVVNFGRLHWNVTPMRVVDGVAEESPDAKVWLEVEARTGLDLSPEVYYEFTDMGTRVPVTQERYQKKLKDQSSSVTNADGLGGLMTITVRPKPGIRAGIESDAKNWTYWSFPVTESGLPLNLNRGSFLQLKVVLHSERFDVFARLDSLWIETSPTLATRILGEIARLDHPEPGRGVAEVNLGEETAFIYDIRAEFLGAERGFDTVQIDVGSEEAVFHSLKLDGIEVAPKAVEVSGSLLKVTLNSAITRRQNPLIRVEFSSKMFDYARKFSAEVRNSNRDDLPQPVENGDAGEDIGTNDLRVLAVSDSEVSIVRELSISSSIFTPNRDGINDQLNVSYQLFGLPEPVGVSLRVFGLDGSALASVGQGMQVSGPQQAEWDGRDADGNVLPPGLYLIDIEIAAENNTVNKKIPVGIAY